MADNDVVDIVCESSLRLDVDEIVGRLRGREPSNAKHTDTAWLALAAKVCLGRIKHAVHLVGRGLHQQIVALKPL